MRFTTVVERTSDLPDPLPEPAGILMPVLLADPERIAARAPRARDSGRPAAVLVLLYPDVDGEARVVLIERTTHDGHHSGEVSFPGGKAEPEDHDLVATALREAAEEVGLDLVQAGVRVVAALESWWIPVSDFHVTPIMALAEHPPRMRPDPREVARILEPRLATFLPDAPIEVVERTIDGWPLRFGAYDVDGATVWGATARILSQLGAALEPR